MQGMKWSLSQAFGRYHEQIVDAGPFVQTGAKLA
jgi:hypothetical protein